MFYAPNGKYYNNIIIIITSNAGSEKIFFSEFSRNRINLIKKWRKVGYQHLAVQSRVPRKKFEKQIKNEDGIRNCLVTVTKQLFY